MLPLLCLLLSAPASAQSPPEVSTDTEPTATAPPGVGGNEKSEGTDGASPGAQPSPPAPAAVGGATTPTPPVTTVAETVDLERTTSTPDGTALGSVFVTIPDQGAGKVFVEQLGEFEDADRAYTTLLQPGPIAGDPGRTVAVPLKLQQSDDLHPGIASARARVTSGGATRELQVDVHTRASLAWLIGAVLLGASAQLVHRLFRPQLDAIAEVRPAVMELKAAIERERWRKDKTLEETLAKGAKDLDAALGLVALRKTRLDKVEGVRLSLAKALRDLATRRTAAQQVVGEAARVASLLNLPGTVAAAHRAVRERTRELTTLLHSDHISKIEEVYPVPVPTSPATTTVQADLVSLANDLRTWRDAVRTPLNRLATIEAPLPPAPSLRDALATAKTRLDAQGFSDASPVGAIVAADDAAFAVRHLLRGTGETLRTLIPRVIAEARRLGALEATRGEGLRVDLDTKRLETELVSALTKLPGDDPTAEAVSRLVQAAAALATALVDTAYASNASDTRKNEAREAFVQGQLLTGIGRLFGASVGRGPTVEGTAVDTTAVDPLDQTAAADVTPAAPSPGGTPAQGAEAPEALPEEWVFDSSRPGSLALEVLTSLALVGVGAWAIWGDDWYGTNVQVGQAVAYGLSANLALSKTIQAFVKRFGAFDLEAPRRKSQVAPPTKKEEGGPAASGAAPGKPAPGESPPKDTADDGTGMSEDDRLGAEDPAAGPDPRSSGPRSESTSKVWRRADVRWAADADAPDYAHIGAPFDPTPFMLTPGAIQAVCLANAYALPPTGIVLFGLRGCLPANVPDGEMVSAVAMREEIPDHVNLRCTIGVWRRDPTGDRIAVFRASTVPNADYMVGYLNGDPKLRCNMRPTGRYKLELGAHQPVGSGPERAVQGAFLQRGPIGVFRTVRDATFDRTDAVTQLSRSDNLHPAGYRPTNYCKFSSAGCMVVEGRWNPDTLTNEDPTDAKGWATFRERAGVTPAHCPSFNVVRPAFGTVYDFVLLTGREVRLAAAGAPLPGRLRFGSAGDRVRQLQGALGFKGDMVDGDFGWLTQDQLTGWQRKTLGVADGIVRSGDLGVSLP